MKLIASDFDGTLRRGPRITEEDLAAISSWRKDGNIFGIITGREISSISRDIEREGIEVDFVAVNNGAQIFDCNGNELYGLSTEGDKLPRIMEFIRDCNGRVGGVSYNGIHRNVFDIGQEIYDFDEKILSEVKKFNQVNTFFRTEEEARFFVKIVNEVFFGVYSAYQNGVCVDIPPSGAGKAAGTAKAAKIFNVKAKDVVTIGDNFNDLEMIKMFAGAAVVNAKPQIKAVASVIVKDFTELIEHISK